jgi:hypothetical protein
LASGGSGTIRSSDSGRRPIIAAHPDRHHSASIAASVGCTGTWRTASVFVVFARRFRVLYASATVSLPSGAVVAS